MMQQTLGFLSIDVGSLLFTLANTLILFLLLKHFLFGRVNAVLEARQQEVADTYRKADDAVEHANQMEAEYTSLMENAKTESAELIKAATKKAQSRSDELLQQAKAEANAVQQQASSEIEQEKKRAKSQLRGEISDLAVLVAEKIVERDIQSADQERLINDFIDNVGDFE